MNVPDSIKGFVEESVESEGSKWYEDEANFLPPASAG